MIICAALAAKTRAKKAERIAQNLAQAARENAQLGCVRQVVQKGDHG